MPHPAKPLALHELMGTKSEAKSPGDSNVPAGRPRYPRNLSAAARTEFKRLCRLLEQRRALTDGDGVLLEIAAQETVRYRKACAKLDAEDEIKIYTRLDSHGQQVQVEKENHWLKVKSDAARSVVAALDRLGLHPLNRDKIKQTAKSELETAADKPGTGAFFLKHGTWGDDGQSRIAAPIPSADSE